MEKKKIIDVLNEENENTELFIIKTREYNTPKGKVYALEPELTITMRIKDIKALLEEKNLFKHTFIKFDEEKYVNMEIDELTKEGYRICILITHNPDVNKFKDKNYEYTKENGFITRKDIEIEKEKFLSGKALREAVEIPDDILGPTFK